MLSTSQQIDLAVTYFEERVKAGIDMSAWRKIRTAPASLTAEELVLLAQHTHDDIGTLLSAGIGVDQKISDLQRVATIDPDAIRASPTLVAA